MPNHILNNQEEITKVLSNWKEPYGDRRQEIVIIGYVDKIDQAILMDCFDSCLLTEREMEEGINSWERYPDPFPSWMMDAVPVAVDVQSD